MQQGASAPALSMEDDASLMPFSSGVPCTCSEGDLATRSNSLPKPCARLSLVLGKTFGSHVAQCWPGAFVCRMLNTSGAACVGFNYGGDSLSSAA